MPHIVFIFSHNVESICGSILLKDGPDCNSRINVTISSNINMHNTKPMHLIRVIFSHNVGSVHDSVFHEDLLDLDPNCEYRIAFVNFQLSLCYVSFYRCKLQHVHLYSITGFEMFKVYYC